jgi:BRCT domain type II-containing protein
LAGARIGPAKLSKARKLSIPIIGENEFLEMINIENLTTGGENDKNITSGTLF